MSPPASCPVSGKAAAAPPPSQKLLAIPGPVQLSPTVQQALTLPLLSHVSPEFVAIFQESLRMTREVVHTTASTAVFLLAGSGTLGWDQVGANLVEPGDRVLVVQTGYFGEGFRECLETYGARATTLAAPLGATVSPAELEAALLSARRKGDGRAYKLVTITHVDTSTGVRADARALAEVVRRVSPGTLVVLDAVCSLASEELRMDDWGVDVVLSASQKGLGAPPGLSVLLAGERALAVWEGRKARGVKSGAFYSSWEKWLPIMRAYDANTPAYFGTPAVSLIRAYHASLTEITRGPISLPARLALHATASKRVSAAAARLGLHPLCTDPLAQAYGMTALWVPEALGPTGAGALLATMSKKGVVLAGGLVAAVKGRYVRIGHMGWSVVGEGGKDVDLVIKALGEAVSEVKAAAEGKGLARL